MAPPSSIITIYIFVSWLNEKFIIRNKFFQALIFTQRPVIFFNFFILLPSKWLLGMANLRQLIFYFFCCYQVYIFYLFFWFHSGKLSFCIRLNFVQRWRIYGFKFIFFSHSLLPRLLQAEKFEGRIFRLQISAHLVQLSF